MRHTFPREFYIPKSETLVTVDCAGTDAAVYTYERAAAGGQVRYFAIAFHGKAAKPDFHFYYVNPEQRANKIAEYLAGRKRRAEYMAERSTARRAPHSLTAGDILHTNWGYDQTNVEYFQVTKVIGPHTVELREIAQSREATGYMTGTCAPLKDQFLEPRYEGDDQGLPIIRRASADGTVKICNVRTAWKGAQALNWSSYA